MAEGRRLEEEIQELCGTRFLVNSTQQLRRVLFDDQDAAGDRAAAERSW